MVRETDEVTHRQSARRLKEVLAFSTAFVLVVSVFYARSAGGASQKSTTKEAKRDSLNQPWNWASVWNMPLGNQAKLDPSKTLISTGKIGGETTVRIDATKGDGVTPIFEVAATVPGQACAVANSKSIVGAALPQTSVDFATKLPGRRVVLAMPASKLFEFEWLVRCDDRSVRTSQRFIRQSLDNDFGQIGIGPVGAGASAMSAIGGHLVPADFRGPKISHALALYLDPKSAAPPRKVTGAVWPARGTATEQPNIAVGSLLVLPPDFRIASLKSAPARAIATALQNFGGYSAGPSSNGSTSFGTIDDPSGGTNAEMNRLFRVSFQELGGCKGADCIWQKDLTQIVTSLRLVTNNSPQTIGGPGGRRTNCAQALRSGVGGAPTTCALNGIQRSTVPINLLAVGDSLTEGGGAGGHISYRGPLQVLLNNDGQSVNFVGSMTDESLDDPEHEGHGGFTVGPDNNRFCKRASATQLDCNPTLFNIASLLPASLSTNAPSIVVLWIGVNDTFTGEIAVGEQGISRTQKPADAPVKIAKLIDQIKSARPDADIVVASLSPLKGGGSPDGDTISSGIREVVASASSATHQVRLVELSDLLLADGDYFDFIHLSESGAQRVAERFFLVLQSLVQLRAN